ncbi:MAG: cysteine hydrolase family protein [Actinomycetota bacterium]|nr:cysteine hydrolase family protein [Actinomycetota bacterium]
MVGTSLIDDAALIIIDVQKGFDDPSWGERNNPAAEQNIEAILGSWREANRPIFHIQHLSTSPTSLLNSANAGSEIKDGVKPLPSEPVITKSVNSAFIGTDLEQRLKASGHRRLVIVGLTTDHCVSTTTRMASNLGFEVYLISDATATFGRIGDDGKYYSAEAIHKINLVSLSGEFATVLETAKLFELLSR